MPAISVVVPIYNVEAYVADCLQSILAQDFDDIEVLLVDDGSLDGSRAIAEEFVARDDRLRLLTRENGGLGAARNTGVREASGEFLTFVDSDDELPIDALGTMVRSARQTRSDIVCGSVERFDSTKSWPARWAKPIHRRRRAGITLDEFPPLVRNLYTPDKLFRREFLVAQDLWFREGVSYEDQPIITQLLARARSIDVLPDVVYRYRQRDDRSSLSQQTATVRDLRDRILAWELSREAAHPRAVSTRVRNVATDALRGALPLVPHQPRDGGRHLLGAARACSERAQRRCPGLGLGRDAAPPAHSGAPDTARAS